MMRAMYSGVAGLKTHQTKMDVIGNNIANVNTVAFKSSTTTFSELMYQNLSGASGPTNNGRGGVNAKQIGLGVSMASTTINITAAGATQTTGDAFDLAITGDSFFVVNNGVSNLFTKAGAFYIDAAGNLSMKSTGYNVMGWQVDPTSGTIKKDTVSPLRIMEEKNLTSPPEATSKGVCAGILDENSPQVHTEAGYAMNLNFYDALGYSYTAKFAVKATDVDGEYTVELKDVMDSNGVSIVETYNATELSDLVKFGEQNIQTDTLKYDLVTGITYDNANKKYYKKAAFPEITSDFEEKKVPGFTYDANNYQVNGTTVTAEGTMKKAAKDLEDIYDVVYVDNDPASATPYYYKKDDVTGTGYKIETAAQWMDVLGVDAASVQNFAFNVANDGTAEFSFDQNFTLIQGVTADPATGLYNVEVTQAEAYGIDLSEPGKTYSFDVAPNGEAQVTISTIITANILKFNTDTGVFTSINGADTVKLDFADSITDVLGNTKSLLNFSDIDVDFTETRNFDNGGASTMGMDPGALDGMTGKGKELGDLIGLSVSNDGTIWGSYDNGNTVLLGQVAVAVFANPSGLEKVGENCYQTTLNSGEFDGIGQEVNADGGKMTSGVLEMSNVDLSTEFTEMITTQRGFQANSRIITTSDTLLEELINLKR